MSGYLNHTVGSRQGFYKIRQHYAILLRRRYSDSVSELLRGEFPALALGISGASLHCLEDLGYAACVGLPAGPVVDALAYLHHSFSPNFISIPRCDGSISKAVGYVLYVRLKTSVAFPGTFSFLARALTHSSTSSGCSPPTSSWPTSSTESARPSGSWRGS